MTELQTINIIVNPSYSKTKWFSDFNKGIAKISATKGAMVNIIIYDNNPTELCEICKICKDTGNRIILVSSSSAWENEVIGYLSLEDIHSIIIRPSVFGETHLCSSVSPDYFNAAFTIMKYFIECGRKKIAFFAYNSDSSQDVQKHNAYEYAISISGAKYSNTDVYINYGNLENCAEKLCCTADSYDAILCANDIAAIVLINKLKNAGKEELLDSLDMASFGDTKLLKMLYPDIISASLNFEKAGECAADLYLYMCANKSIVTCEYKVSSDINIPSPRKKVLSLKPSPDGKISENGISFYNDKSVVDVFKVENALAQCDELDIKIIEFLLKKLSYEMIAEHTNTAVTTVKYRFKKILSFFGVSSRSELFDLLSKYFN